MQSPLPYCKAAFSDVRFYTVCRANPHFHDERLFLVSSLDQVTPKQDREAEKGEEADNIGHGRQNNA